MECLRMDCEHCPVRGRGLCKALSPSGLAELKRIHTKRRILAHEPIFHDQDKVDHYFNIGSGVVKLVKTLADGKQHIISLLYPGDFMGRSLNSRYAYAAEAATDVELCSYPRAAFEAFLKKHPEFERRIHETTLRELDLCRDWIMLLGHKCSYERVAGFLLMMAKHAPSFQKHAAIELELPFTRAEMADYLGLTLETVSRQFSRLKRKKIIILSSARAVVIPDIELLAAIARIESCDSEADAEENRDLPNG